MLQTVEVLKAEANRLRALAAKIDALVSELTNENTTGGSVTQSSVAPVVEKKSWTLNFPSKKTHVELVVEALADGPKTTNEVVDKVNANGEVLRKPQVATILSRFRGDKFLRDDDDGKWSLKVTE